MFFYICRLLIASRAFWIFRLTQQPLYRFLSFRVRFFFLIFSLCCNYFLCIYRFFVFLYVGFQLLLAFMKVLSVLVVDGPLTWNFIEIVNRIALRWPKINLNKELCSFCAREVKQIIITFTVNLGWYLSSTNRKLVGKQVLVITASWKHLSVLRGSDSEIEN